MPQTLARGESMLAVTSPEPIRLAGRLTAIYGTAAAISLPLMLMLPGQRLPLLLQSTLRGRSWVSTDREELPTAFCGLRTADSPTLMSPERLIRQLGPRPAALMMQATSWVGLSPLVVS